MSTGEADLELLSMPAGEAVFDLLRWLGLLNRGGEGGRLRAGLRVPSAGPAVVAGGVGERSSRRGARTKKQQTGARAC